MREQTREPTLGVKRTGKASERGGSGVYGEWCSPGTAGRYGKAECDSGAGT